LALASPLPARWPWSGGKRGDYKELFVMALPKDGCLDGAKITEVGGVGYKELLVMALPKDDSIDGAKVAEAIGVKLPDVGGAIRVRKSPPDFMSFPCLWSNERDTTFGFGQLLFFLN
jgi:hypothetical protein